MFPLLVLFGRLSGWSQERVPGCGTGEQRGEESNKQKQQVSVGDGVPDNVLWVQQSATTTWTEVENIYAAVVFSVIATHWGHVPTCSFLALLT